jgi:hypothetical protein
MQRSTLALALVLLAGCSAPRAQTEKEPPAGQVKSQPDISPSDAARIPPMPPVGVEVVKDAKKAIVSWEPSLFRGVTSYGVYRKVGAGKFEKLAVIDEPKFVDRKMPTGAVTYSVTALTAAGVESPLSQPALKKPLPKTPEKH